MLSPTHYSALSKFNERNVSFLSSYIQKINNDKDIETKLYRVSRQMVQQIYNSIEQSFKVHELEIKSSLKPDIINSNRRNQSNHKKVHHKSLNLPRAISDSRQTYSKISKSVRCQISDDHIQRQLIAIESEARLWTLQSLDSLRERAYAGARENTNTEPDRVLQVTQIQTQKDYQTLEECLGTPGIVMYIFK